MAAVAMIAATAMADYTTGTVSGLTARQRRPWNGLVDISFTLSGPEAKYCVAIAATNAATGAAIPVRALRDKAGNAVSRNTKFTPGAVALVWDAMSDAPELLVEALALSVVTAPYLGVQLWEDGPYWAETNIGADEPCDYGFYFWWGDTIGYRCDGNAWVASDGSLQNFSFETGNTPTYNESPSALQSEGWVIKKDGTYVLAPEHDAARVHWGGDWRMPTYAELSALNNNCDWTWTAMNGVNGYVVRGRDAYFDASIFLPCAGKVSGSSLYADGSNGSYWSSVPYSKGSANGSARYLRFRSSDHTTDYGGRDDGLSVRPVRGFAE